MLFNEMSVSILSSLLILGLLLSGCGSDSGRLEMLNELISEKFVLMVTSSGSVRDCHTGSCGCTESSFELAPSQLPSGVTYTSTNDGGHALELSVADAKTLLTPRLQTASTPMADWAQQADSIAVINGGYFYASTPLSLVVINGERLADNVAAVTRNGQSYPVLRSGLWMTRDGEANIGWVGIDSEDGLRSFPEPMPYQRNQSKPLTPPAGSAGSEIDPLWAIGGGPRLLHHGVAAIAYDEEIFWGSGVELNDVRPRTAICITQDNSLVLYVNEGARLDAMPEKLLALGCEEAMNLDGGGSSAMYVAGQEILDQQRAVPAVLAIRAAD